MEPRGQQFSMWEGHYTYPGSDLTFIPTYSGGMFEGLMPNEIVPESSWGTRSFGLADARTVQVQIKYATQQLHDPVWGMSPSSTPIVSVSSPCPLTGWRRRDQLWAATRRPSG